MTDLEFTVLDELYFVQSFSDLRESTGLSDEHLLATLKDLSDRGWIKVLEGLDDEVVGPIDWVVKFEQYYYLASKKGLMAHNTN